MLLFFFESTATMIEQSISTEFQSINFEHSLILISFNTPCSVNKLIRNLAIAGNSNVSILLANAYVFSYSVYIFSISLGLHTSVDLVSNSLSLVT